MRKPFIVGSFALAALAWLSVGLVTRGDSINSFAQPGLVKLQQTKLASPAASVTFSSIPATYTNLSVTIVASCSNASAVCGVAPQFNGDTGANYEWDFIQGNGATVTAGTFDSQVSGFVGNIAGGSAPANSAGTIHVRIPDYAGGFTKLTNAMNYTVDATTITSTKLLIQSGTVWNSTAAINSITFIVSAGNFTTGSIFTLYGEQ